MFEIISVCVCLCVCAHESIGVLPSFTSPRGVCVCVFVCVFVCVACQSVCACVACQSVYVAYRLPVIELVVEGHLPANRVDGEVDVLLVGAVQFVLCVVRPGAP